MGKYDPLRSFLSKQATSEVRMTFSEIEKVIGASLPEKSKRNRPWWSNNPNNNVMTKEWLAAGYKTEQVDIEGRRLVFRRVAPLRSTEDRLTESPSNKSPRRHPLFGWLKGTVTIAPGVDLTEPADPDWGNIAWGENNKETKK
jgi:hypothetical protein